MEDLLGKPAGERTRTADALTGAIEPPVDLIRALASIGELKNSERQAPELRGYFDFFGLYVQMSLGSLPPMLTGFEHDQLGWLLEAGERSGSHLDAWRTVDEERWHTVTYEPGPWEELVAPSVELADFFYERLRGPDEKIQHTLAIGEHLKTTGRLDTSPIMTQPLELGRPS